MIKKELSFKNASFTLKINRVKDKYEGILTLYHKNDKAHEKGLKVHTFNKKECDQIPNIEEMIGNTYEVTVDSKKVEGMLKKEGSPEQDIKFVIECDSIIEEGVIIDLTLGKDNKTAYLHFDTVIFGSFDCSELPDNLFKNRRNFRVVVINDETIRLIRYFSHHQHTEYSLLDGLIKIKDLAKKCEYAGAITDHGSMGGYLEFYKEMKALNKKPVIGMEAYIETPLYPKNGKSNLRSDHLIILAKNETGLKNLFYLATHSSLNFYKHPHVTYEMLESHHDGLIVTTACIGGTLGKAIIDRIEALKNVTVHQASLINTDSDFIEMSEQEIEKYDEQTKWAFKMYSKSIKIEYAFINKMKELFGDDFYVEIQNHMHKVEDDVMVYTKEIAKKHNVKTVIGIDSHYLNKEDSIAHAARLCVQTKTTLDDEDRMVFSGNGYYIHNSDEVLERFANDLDSVDRTLEILDKCNVEIEFGNYHLPEFKIPQGYKDQTDYFLKLCRKSYLNKFKGTTKVADPVYLERMKFEIDTILNMGWAGYFLIVQDFIKYAKDDNLKETWREYFPDREFSDIPEFLIKDFEVFVGKGRGSGAGSLVNYILGITDADPIEYGLLFERFLNPDRISMPDIDTDFEDTTRWVVIEYAKYKYGKDHVSRILTYGTAAARSVILDTVRVNGLDVSLARKINKLIPGKPGTTIAKALDEVKELSDLYFEDETVQMVIDLAKKLEGYKKNRSVHACGIIISDKPVYEYMPQCLMENAETGELEWTTQLTMNECEEIGCLKADFLGLRNLSIVHNALKMINYGKPKEEHLIFEDIPIYDFDMYQAWARAETDAVFQFESAAMKNILKNIYQDVSKYINVDLADVQKHNLAVQWFNRASDATALGRPGPMAEIPHYVENMLHPESIKYEDDRLKDILKDTNGIIVYQEQMMAIVRALAGFTPGQADNVRKAMSKKLPDKLMEYGNYFIYGNTDLNIKGCVANGISKSDSENIWRRMEDFGKYAFNKSHSIVYTILSAQTGYLAVHYPLYFYAAVLNSYIKKSDKLISLLSVLKKKKIEVIAPNVNLSRKTFIVNQTGDKIIFGLSGLKGVGGASEAIVEERDRGGEFTSYFDFIYRMSLAFKGFDKKTIVALIDAGAVDSIKGDKTRSSLIEAVESTLKTIKGIRQDKNLPLFQFLPEEWTEFQKNSYEFTIKDFDEYPMDRILQKERESAGYYISGHPLARFDKYLDSYGILTTAIFNDYEETDATLQSTDSEDDEMIDVVAPIMESNFESFFGKFSGIVREVETLYTKKDGLPMLKFELEDRDGKLSCICFNKEYEEHKEIIQDNAILLIEGKVDQSDFGIQLVVKKVISLTDLAKPLHISNISCHANDEEPLIAEKQLTQLKSQIEKADKGSTVVLFFTNGTSQNLTINGTIEVDDQLLTAIDCIVGERNRYVEYD